MADIDFSKIYSFSKLKLFDNCRKLYYFNYLDPVIAPIKKQFVKPRAYKTKGQAVHGAITLFYHLPEKERTFSNLKKCLSQAWFSEKDPYKKPPLGKKGGFRDLKEEKKVYLESLHLLKSFYNMEKENCSLFLIPTAKIRDSFEDYEKMIKPINEDFSLSGKFDRIDRLKDGTLKVVDFKTGNNESDHFQLEFYKLLAEMNFDAKVSKVSFYYLSKEEIKEVDVSDVKKEDLEKKILSKIKKVRKADNFDPNPGKLCWHCDFREICPVHNKGRNN